MKVCALIQAEDEFVYWPNWEEPKRCEGFSITLMGKDRLPLSADQEIGVHDFILEATQVTARADICVYLCETAQPHLIHLPSVPLSVRMTMS